MLNTKKIYMWYQVKKLHQQGFNKSQISRQSELDRGTVRKYLQMSEEEFHSWLSEPKNLPLKLSKYLPFVKKELQNFPAFSAAQIEDRLKEHFTDLPCFHSKTVYNFVQMVRLKYDIPKPNTKESRVFEKLPETAYGEQAQVDFGETWLQTVSGKRRKIYFFVMVLSRSRYKFVCIENKPFTTVSSVYAHELAFEYFGGVPKEILYDQDSVFISDENLGDYKLTAKFKTYCDSQDFKPVFCRKADPQSKGKVENVVKYVKQNFLRGRKFVGTEAINKEVLSWLERTGNAKRHSGTQKIPFIEWNEEKKYLLLKKKKGIETNILKSYKARKDNTIIYKSNFYSLPAGTYKNKETNVLLRAKEGELFIYLTEEELIARHKISIGRGEYIRNSDHARQKSKTTQENEKKVFEILGETEITKMFLLLLRKKKSRYYRDNLQYIIQKIHEPLPEIVHESLLFCIENKQFNASVLSQIIKKKTMEKEKKEQAENFMQTGILSSEGSVEIPETKVEKNNINEYEKIFKSCKN